MDCYFSHATHARTPYLGGVASACPFAEVINPLVCVCVCVCVCVSVCLSVCHVRVNLRTGAIRRLTEGSIGLSGTFFYKTENEFSLKLLLEAF